MTKENSTSKRQFLNLILERFGIIEPKGDQIPPITFEAELNRQCRRILPYLAFSGIFTWLGFIPMDIKLNPGVSLIVYCRIGLTVFCTIALIISPLKVMEKRIYWVIVCLGAYLALATALLTAAAHFAPPYAGGFSIIMVGLIIGPLKKKHLFWIGGMAMLTFLLACLYFNVSITSTQDLYSINNLVAALILFLIGSIVNDTIRRRNYEKSIAINQERQKSDSLLLNILPKEVARELKEKGASKPVLYSSASVLFTDFQGFTKIAEHLEPEALVDELDKCFSYFDSITKKYNLEKIKTIGDSYMLCGGVPIENATHAVDCVMAAIEIQAFMKQMQEVKELQGHPYWVLRLGINTGPLVAGVIGELKFAYDVFGDTVNTASRMESSGVAGRITVSESTYDAVKDFFICEYRGRVPAKNKGEINMYFVNGIRPELARLDDNRVPNEQFNQKYEELKNYGHNEPL